MNIFSTQDDPDHASTHGRLDISNALPPNTLPLSTLFTTLPNQIARAHKKGYVSTLGRLRDYELVWFLGALIRKCDLRSNGIGPQHIDNCVQL